jgi:hypothetical protein
MGNIEVISSHVEEHPIYHDYTKNDFVGEWPGYPKLDFDPFPDKSSNDVVRTEIIARKLVLRAKVRGDVLALHLSSAIPFEGRNYTVESASMNLDVHGDNHTGQIEAFHLLTPLGAATRLKHLAALRAAYSAKTVDGN